VAASNFYRRLHSRLVQSAGGDGATLGSRLWDTVKTEVRGFVGEVWAGDVFGHGDGPNPRSELWRPNLNFIGNNPSQSAHEVYRAAIRGHFHGLVRPDITPSEFLAVRDAFLTGIDAEEPTSSAEAVSVNALFYRLAYIRLRVLQKLAKGSMLYVDTDDVLRLVRQPTNALESSATTISSSSSSTANQGTNPVKPLVLDSGLPFLPKVDPSADPPALFSPHGTRLLFVCSKDVSPSSTLPFPNGRKNIKKRKEGSWPNFGDEVNKRCLVSCWVDGTDWREMDLTWVG
jgi:hypothetical protein